MHVELLLKNNTKQDEAINKHSLRSKQENLEISHILYIQESGTFTAKMDQLER